MTFRIHFLHQLLSEISNLDAMSEVNQLQKINAEGGHGWFHRAIAILCKCNEGTKGNESTKCNKGFKGFKGNEYA